MFPEGLAGVGAGQERGSVSGLGRCQPSRWLGFGGRLWRRSRAAEFWPPLAHCVPCLHSNLRDTHGVVLDIAAAGSTSAVMTHESKVLMWGSGVEGVVKVPTAIPGNSVQDVFAAWAQVSVTPVPLVVSPFSTTDSGTQGSNRAPGWEGNLSNIVAENFNNPTCSDVKFAVGNETIHAHRAVLCFQSEYFRNMFKGAWKDSGGTIEVSEFSYPVYEAFLRYFYTGEVNLPATECLELLDLAKTCSDSVLKMKCQRRIEVMISVENCANVYAAAFRCGAKELEDFCFRFALDNLAAVTQTPAFATLPDHVFRTFYAEVAKNGVFNK